MPLFLKDVWQERIRRQIFPPSCSQAGCSGAKRIWRGTPMVLVDGRWVCSAACLEAAALAQLEGLCAIRAMPSQHRIPLGLLMLSRGYINEEQLQTLLTAQHEGGSGKLGYWARMLQFVTERQLLNALSLQWACPVLALQTPPDLACAELLPWHLLGSLRMMPVRFVWSTRLLYMAVSEEVEHTALSAVERVLNCRVVACLVSDRAMDRWLENESPRALGAVAFEKTSGPAEMARITGSYVERLGADQVHIVRCGRYAWVRLRAGGRNSDLLFNVSPAQSERKWLLSDELVAAAV